MINNQDDKSHKLESSLYELMKKANEPVDRFGKKLNFEYRQWDGHKIF